MKKWIFTYLIIYIFVSASAMIIAHFTNLGGDLSQRPEVAELVRKSQVANLQEVEIDRPLQIENKEEIISFLAIFVAQVYSVQLDVFSYMIIMISVYFAAVSETAIPLGSLSIVFIPLGLPVVFLTMFMVMIDWITSPFRTLFNMFMNYTGSVLVAGFEDESHEAKVK